MTGSKPHSNEELFYIDSPVEEMEMQSQN